MKKLTAIILLLTLCLSLAACGGEALVLTPRTHEGITISIPEDFIDLSDEEFAADLSFVYGLDPIAVNGLREPKSTFEAYGLELDLERYGDFILKANNVSSDLEERDGILTFTYEANGYTYVVTLWETDDAFWTVQAYCPTDSFKKVEKDMWQILSSVTV